MTLWLITFGVLGAGVAWYIATLPRQTYYRSVSTDMSTNGNNALDGREERKKHFMRATTRILIWYFGACIFFGALAAIMPKAKAVQAALNPSASPTVTMTIPPSKTSTPRMTPTSATRTPHATLTLIPSISLTPSSTPTPRVIYQQVTSVINQNIPVTVIVQRTVVVYQTVIVYQTVMVTPTFTALPPSSTPTLTETTTPTQTFTPTETPTP